MSVMGLWFAALALTMTLAPAQEAGEILASRTLPEAFVVLAEPPGINFDIYDARAQMEEIAVAETEPHSIFRIRRHVGVAAGYDSGVLHGSIGMYITVAEWGRWNFGVPSPEVGFGRY